MIDQESSKTTFWGNNVLLKSRPALEQWCKLQNGIENLFHGRGFTNDVFESGFGIELSHMFKKYDIDMPNYWCGDIYKSPQLKKLADIVFAEAMEEKVNVENAA